MKTLILNIWKYFWAGAFALVGLILVGIVLIANMSTKDAKDLWELLFV